jgi:hypothetical protein|tara:strand:+ start:1931 stop:2080 length:150 start_codon:yes stop_codon:yes gene_type:complete
MDKQNYIELRRTEDITEITFENGDTFTFISCDADSEPTPVSGAERDKDG